MPPGAQSCSYLGAYTGCLKNWVLANWAPADPVSDWGEIHVIFVANPHVLQCNPLPGKFGAFCQTGTLGAYWVCKGALKNKRTQKNKWFLNIILTGIYPTSLDLTGSVGFVTKNHKYFSPTTSRIRRCSICQNSVFLDTLYVGAIPDICQFW